MDDNQSVAATCNVSLITPDTNKEMEILSGIGKSLKEAKAGKTFPIDSLW